MKWAGPYTIDELLDSFSNPLPPVDARVYLISREVWMTQPTEECIPLYVGSNKDTSTLFRSRIGDLIADLFGLYYKGDGGKGHHSGGQSLHRYSVDHGLNPKLLLIGWTEECPCPRCLENELYDSLKPELNKIRPSRCEIHFSKHTI